MMSSCRKLKNITTAECILQVSVYFSAYHNYLLDWLLILTFVLKIWIFSTLLKNIYTRPQPQRQNTFFKRSTRTQKNLPQCTMTLQKCIFMPLNVLPTPIPFGIRNDYMDPCYKKVRSRYQSADLWLLLYLISHW